MMLCSVCGCRAEDCNALLGGRGYQAPSEHHAYVPLSEADTVPTGTSAADIARALHLVRHEHGDLWPVTDGCGGMDLAIHIVNTLRAWEGE